MTIPNIGHWSTLAHMNCGKHLAKKSSAPLGGALGALGAGIPSGAWKFISKSDLRPTAIEEKLPRIPGFLVLRGQPLLKKHTNCCFACGFWWKMCCFVSRVSGFFLEFRWIFMHPPSTSSRKNGVLEDVEIVSKWAIFHETMIMGGRVKRSKTHMKTLSFWPWQSAAATGWKIHILIALCFRFHSQPHRESNWKEKLRKKTKRQNYDFCLGSKQKVELLQRYILSCYIIL